MGNGSSRRSPCFQSPTPSSSSDHFSCGEDIAYETSLMLRLRQATDLHESICDCLSTMSTRKIRDNEGAKERLLALWDKERGFLQRLEEGKLEANLSRLSSSNFPHLHALLCILQSPLIEDICDVVSPIEFTGSSK